jgi:hypothetical protein
MHVNETPHPPTSPAPRPPWAGFDLDPARRPGVPKERTPAPWPHARFPPARMEATPSAPTHDRKGKPMPPVFGTAVPLHGVSGLLRKAAYRYPDHVTRHWTMLLLADRVDAWGLRTRRLLKVAVPLAAVAIIAARILDARR